RCGALHARPEARPGAGAMGRFRRRGIPEADFRLGCPHQGPARSWGSAPGCRTPYPRRRAEDLMTPESLTLSVPSLTTVGVCVVIALVAVAMAMRFRSEVLRARTGTEAMDEVAGAVQEGAAAYLRRQLRTLGVFAAIAFVLLLLLPTHGAAGAEGVLLRGARSVAFLAGAAFSGLIGYLGMWLAVRANVRVAAAAHGTGRDPAMLIAVRTGACVGMATI